MSTINTALEKLRSELPPIFNITEVDRLTGGALRRRTLANMRSRGDVPESIFIKEGSRKVLLVRDELLPWWGSRLTPVTNLQIKQQRHLWPSQTMTLSFWNLYAQNIAHGPRLRKRGAKEIRHANNI